MTPPAQPDVRLVIRVRPGEEDFATSTAMTLGRFVRGAGWAYAQPGLIWVTVGTRGLARVERFFGFIGRQIVRREDAP